MKKPNFPLPGLYLISVPDRRGWQTCLQKPLWSQWAKNYLFFSSCILTVLLFSGCNQQTQSTSLPTETSTPTQVTATHIATPKKTPANSTTPSSSTPTETAEIETEIATPETATSQSGVVEPTATSATQPTPVSCQPTPPDAEGPFYVPNAPERSSVGRGHILSGVVRSSPDCTAIPNAQIELGVFQMT